MPSANAERGAVVVLHIRRAHDDTEMRAEIKKASKQQKHLTRALPYYDRSPTANGFSAHDKKKRKIKQQLNSAIQRCHPPAKRSKKDDKFAPDTTSGTRRGERSLVPLPINERLRTDQDPFESEQGKELKDSKRLVRRKAAPESRASWQNRKRRRPGGDIQAASDVRDTETSPYSISSLSSEKQTGGEISSILECDQRESTSPSKGTAADTAGEATYDMSISHAVPQSTKAQNNLAETLPPPAQGSSKVQHIITDLNDRATNDTNKEAIDTEHGLLEIKELGPQFALEAATRASRDAKEVVQSWARQDLTGRPVVRGARHTFSFAAGARKIKAKVKKLLHHTRQDPGQRSSKEISLTINAWAKSVAVPWVIAGPCFLPLSYMPDDRSNSEAGVASGNHLSYDAPTLCGRGPDQVPKLIDFRTKDDLWRYLHPEVGSRSCGFKTAYKGGTPCSSSANETLLEDPAELPAPAYEEVMSRSFEPAPDALVRGKGKSRAINHTARGPCQCAEGKPEDIWLYTPRSCAACGDFGILPLHYCASCKKLLVNMCSECYTMGHDSCHKLGHEVMEAQRLQDIPPLDYKVPDTASTIKDPVAQSGANTAQYHTMDTLLNFLTAERSFMREEVRQARLNSAATEQLAARDQADTIAFRTAKLSQLSLLITDEEGRMKLEARNLEARKSLESAKNSAVIPWNHQHKDPRQADGSHLPEASGTSRQSNEQKNSVFSEGLNQAGASVSVPSPEKTLPSASGLRSPGLDGEVINLNAALRRQENLQCIRERELRLREKEFELRERDFSLQLKERRLGMAEQHDNQPKESQPSSATCRTALSTSRATPAPGLVEMTTPVPDTPHENSDPISACPSACSEISMVECSPVTSTLSPPSFPNTPKREIFHLSAFLVKRLLANLFSHKSRKGTRSHAGNGTRRNGGSQFPAAPNTSKSRPSTTTRKRARKTPLSRSNSGRSNQSGTDEESNKRRKKVLKTKANPGSLWACPYSKFDPFRYSGRNLVETEYRRCSNHTLRDIPRLKQHLYRVHKRPEIHCPRCYMAFASKSLAIEHARLPVQCATIPCPFPEKFDDDHTKELKRRQQGKTEEECWFSIYKLLFPDAIRPAHPCKSPLKSSGSGKLTKIDLEDPGELLVSQLSSSGASHSLSQMVIACLIAQLEGSSEYAGLLNHENQAQMMQAIEESLPTFVQQMFQSHVASASSSSTSLHDSGTTPGSSSDQGTRGPKIHVQPPAFQNARRVDVLQAVDRPWAPLQPINGYSMSEQPKGSFTRALSPSCRTSSALATDLQYPPDAMQPNLRRPVGGSLAPTFNELRNSSENTSYGDRCFGTRGVAVYTPMSNTLDRRSSIASTIRVADMSNSRLVPSQVPQFVQAHGLKPRKSMDSGYISMHALPLDETWTAEHITYNGDPSDFRDSLPRISHSGSTLKCANSRPFAFDNDCDQIEKMKQTPHISNEGSLQAEHGCHTSGPFLHRAASAPHDLHALGSYSQEDDANPGSYGSISDPCLPFFSQSGKEAPIEDLNIYDGEPLWPSNPWS